MPNSNHSLFAKLKSYLAIGTVFLFPLLFLPFTQEYFVTTKFYFLGIVALVFLTVSTIEFLTTRKLVWIKKQLDSAVFLFILSVGLSTVIVSPNKIQALLNPNFGVVMLVSLGLLYYYVSRNVARKTLVASLLASSLVLALLTIVNFFQPFKNADLTTSLQFLKNPTFTPIGNQLDLVIYLGFALVLALSSLLSLGKKADVDNKQYGVLLVAFGGILLGALVTLYSLLKTNPPVLPPLYLSWFAAVEILKNPLTALFGVGVDNFASIFTRVKDISYNMSSLWQVNSFAASRSTLLHIVTEAGVFGLIGIGMIILFGVRDLMQNHRRAIDVLLASLYALITIVIFPVSLSVFFILFIVLAMIMSKSRGEHTESDVITLPMADIIPLYVGITAVCLIVIGGAFYFLMQTYRAEYYYKLSLNGIVNNNIKDLYDNQRSAILINPYIERFRINFSQTNLLIANNIAAKAQPAQNKQPVEGEQNPATPQLSEEDRQTVAQAIQAAIAESKAAVALNSQKPANWENLAVIYRNILNVAQGADAWTVSAYQRAIILDPQNPLYRLNLGGVYYSLNNYTEARKLFEQSVALKQDWANSHYNLAWAAYQTKDYQFAAQEMQNVVQLLDQKTDKADYDRAKKDLEEFKKKIPTQDESKTETDQQTNKIGLPTPPINEVEPKISLPQTASPEAN